jgi:hypothetical protein
MFFLPDYKYTIIYLLVEDFLNKLSAFETQNHKKSYWFPNAKL